MTNEEMKKKIDKLEKRIAMLEAKIHGEGKISLSKKELRIDRSTNISDILNFKDTVNSIIDLSIPGDGKFLRAASQQYIPSLITWEDIYASELLQGYVPYFNTTAWANSPIYIVGSNTGIGGYPLRKFHIQGTDDKLMRISGATGSYDISLQTANTLSFYNSVTDAVILSLQMGGNVGVGISAPTSKLHVVGDILISEKLGCNGATPQAAYALGDACADLVTVIALANLIRTALINNGVGKVS